MRLRLISCEVFTREMCRLIAESPQEIDVSFLPKGLHDLGAERMQAHLQAALADVEEELYDAVLFGFGLCNNGLVGLRAGTIPLVLPRAHDCITLFLGSKQRYQEYFQNNPGVYFLTSGWIERGTARGEISQLSISKQSGMDMTYEELVEQYGEDNAEFLWEELVQNKKHYGKYAFIEMGVEPDERFQKEAQRRAEEKGWQFEKMQGQMTLLRQLLWGEWPEADFLVVPPGHQVVARYDEGIIAARPGETGGCP